MTRAAGFFAPGGPEALDLIDVPEPHAGPGQVRVRSYAAGVQPLDAAVVAGMLPPMAEPPPYPRIPGNELAGVVDEVGAGVTGVTVGDEVLGFGTLHCYAEHVVVPAEQVTPKPAALPWVVAGGLSAPAQTAHIALTELGVGAGDTVLITGAAGAVGHLAVQLARAWGATVIGAARDTQQGFLRSLDAIPVVLGPGFADRVRAAAPGGITVALDAVGGDALDASLTQVDDPKQVLTIADHGRAAELGVRLTPPARSAQRLAGLAAMVAAGTLTLHVLATFPLERAADAIRRLRAGNVRGKIVLTID